MAVATAENALVLSRFKDQFRDNKTNELVEYFQARVLDLDSGDIVVVSAKSREELAPLAPGSKIKNFEYEIKDVTSIRAVKATLAGASALSTRENF